MQGLLLRLRRSSSFDSRPGWRAGPLPGRSGLFHWCFLPDWGGACGQEGQSNNNAEDCQMRWCFHGLQSLIGVRAMILSMLTIMFTACRLSYSLLTEENRASYYNKSSARARRRLSGPEFGACAGPPAFAFREWPDVRTTALQPWRQGFEHPEATRPDRGPHHSRIFCEWPRRSSTSRPPPQACPPCAKCRPGC